MRCETICRKTVAPHRHSLSTSILQWELAPWRWYILSIMGLAPPFFFLFFCLLFLISVSMRISLPHYLLFILIFLLMSTSWQLQCLNHENEVRLFDIFMILTAIHTLWFWSIALMISDKLASFVNDGLFRLFILLLYVICIFIMPGLRWHNPGIQWKIKHKRKLREFLQNKIAYVYLYFKIWLSNLMKNCLELSRVHSSLFQYTLTPLCR